MKLPKKILLALIASLIRLLDIISLIKYIYIYIYILEWTESSGFPTTVYQKT